MGRHRLRWVAAAALVALVGLGVFRSPVPDRAGVFAASTRRTPDSTAPVGDTLPLGAPDCPGPVEVVTEGGEPVVAEVGYVVGEGVSQMTHRTGAPNVWMAGRPCSASAWVAPAGEDTLWKGLRVLSSGQTDTIRVPDAHPLRLRTVDADGLPVDARLIRPTLVRVGEGRFEGSLRARTASVHVAASGFVPRQVEVQVGDPREVVVALERGRLVVVEAVCDADGCPPRLYCDRLTLPSEADPCEGADGHYVCRCADDGSPSELSAQGWRTPDTLATIAPDAERVTVDLRFRPAGLYGRWTGGTPATGTILRRGARDEVMGHLLVVERDGSFYAALLPAGAYDVHLSGPLGSTSRFVEVQGGQRLNLGVLAPDSVRLEGWVLLGDDLEGARLVVGAAEASMDAHGRFVAEVSPAAAWATFRLAVPGGGRYRATLRLVDGMVWAPDHQPADTGGGDSR